MSTSKPQPLKSAQLEDLRQQQLDATADPDGRGQVPYVTSSKRDDYEFPAHEQHLVHVELVTFVRIPGTRDFDKKTQVQKFSPAEFERMEKNDSFAPYQGDDGEVNILHDPRSAARQQADKTGDVKTGSPAEANKPLASLQDAQMRYKELTGDDAPTDKSFEELLPLIADLEKKKHADRSTSGGKSRTLRSLDDYRVRYKELTGDDAPADKKIADLKEAIQHLEKGDS